ncbi:MAG: LPP20 family lipoprotein [Sulfurimonas sp.]|uniref:LPP20 family lipoprotein n=1 Tax=Sulfurimonas sp. TaxID=2022749 RepID=UPI0026290E87|nr:LPP20 family lipoprotein [Sulfurimonas sp.]MCW8895239.1 LPP20 family lipoprotein [Sulfurimonas sp.]MCW8953673.1 LPP20 family lipoprotein [Sulfurimonas sp.]MCW9067590.1 LPP20 family lipoprotein [Sulfurimonas sp.]
MSKTEKSLEEHSIEKSNLYKKIWDDMYKLTLPLLIFLFTGCSLTVQPEVKQNEQLPTWVNSFEPLRAVGSSEVNFQGIYSQRLEAMNKARNDLAHNLRSYITSVFDSESKTQGEKISNKSSDKVTALSEIFLNESYQVDAYFDKNARLYVLVESSKEKIDRLIGNTKAKKTHKTALSVLKTRPFDKDELMKSRCYAPNILKTITTKSSLYQNKPVWFFRPNQNGVMGSVGIAEKEEKRTFEEQKRVALSLAKASLEKRLKTQIISEHEVLKIVNGDTSGEIFETSSVVKSASKVQPSVEKDIWLDPYSCELYVWSVAK